MSVAEDLRQANHAALADFVEHPFFVRAGQGTLTPGERDAYFHFEHDFVEQAVTVFGHILVKAPDSAARTHLVQILHGLTTDQAELFATLLRRTGPAPPPPWPEAVSAFRNGMTRIAADGAYHEGLAAMLAAEWTYARVSTQLMEQGLHDTLLRDWFALHTEEGFLRGVAWIEAELDRHVRTAAQFTEASAAFAQAVVLEIAFHSAALNRSETGQDARLGEGDGR